MSSWRDDLAELSKRVDRAIAFIEEHQHTDGAHHKQWLLNQVYLILTDGTKGLEDEGIIP